MPTVNVRPPSRLFTWLRQAVCEFVSVVIGSMTIGAGLGFLQSICIHRLFSLDQIERDEIVEAEACFAGLIGSMETILLYYIFIRGSELAVVCRIVMVLLAVGLTAGYAIDAASLPLMLLIVLFTTMLVVSCSSEPTSARMGGGATRAKIRIVTEASYGVCAALCGVILSIGTSVWVGQAAFGSWEPRFRLALTWGVAGLVFGPVMYYTLGELLTLRLLAVTLVTCWAAGFTAAYLDGGWVLSLATWGSAVGVTVYARLRGPGGTTTTSQHNAA